MNNYVLLAVSMGVCLLGTLLRKVLASRCEISGNARLIYSAVTSVIAAMLLAAISDLSVVSAFTLMLGLVFGMVTTVAQISLLRATELGPLSYTTVITSLSMLIPALSGAMFWGERIRVIQVAGMVLMVGCLALSVDLGEDGRNARGSLHWLFYCGIAFVSNGMIGVLQKWHQNSPSKGEGDALLVIAFLFSFLCSVLLLALSWLRKAHQGQVDKTLHIEDVSSTATMGTLFGWMPMLILVVMGLSGAVINRLCLYLSGVMDSAVFFPVYNGGGMILATISAYILFRERLSHRQWIGILLGIIAVFCLCDPFQ